MIGWSIELLEQFLNLDWVVMYLVVKGFKLNCFGALAEGRQTFTSDGGDAGNWRGADEKVVVP